MVFYVSFLPFQGTPHGSMLNLSNSFSLADRPGTPGSISQGSGGR